MYVHKYIYICIYVYMYIYIYISIDREREGYLDDSVDVGDPALVRVDLECVCPCLEPHVHLP